MKNWYHPSPANKGSACSFYLNDEENSFFASIIKQKSWDATTRRASFHKDDPNERVIIKFSCKEICAIIDCVENNREFSGYHGSNQIVRFKFGPYAKRVQKEGQWVEGPQVGYSLSVTKESKEDSTNKKTFGIGLDYSEAKELELFLRYLVNRNFENDKAAQPQRKPYNKNGAGTNGNGNGYGSGYGASKGGSSYRQGAPSNQTDEAPAPRADQRAERAEPKSEPKRVAPAEVVSENEETDIW